jgi:phosphoribosylformylglycinamidine synthase subunit PurQ / glutaminase
VTAQVAVVRFPGSNCEAESLAAIERVGLSGRIVRWNVPESELRLFDAYILPGGFSYQDRIRAGAVAARLPLIDVIAGRAHQGAPVFGICNGAQILVEAGLVPGGGDDDPVRLALAPNQIRGRDGYYTRWVFLSPGPAADSCLFTRGLREPIPMPMAHGEGRFVTADPALAAQLPACVPLQYARPDGSAGAEFPFNPNGSQAAAAGVTNGSGTVLALMPHPERAQVLAQVPEHLEGPWGDRRRAGASAAALDQDGPGLQIFRALARALRE